MANTDNTLLLTKLHRPPITRGLIDRPLLFEQLTSGIDRPLTLVLASAGFGKTTLVSAWLARLAAGQFAPAAGFPAAWLSLDENDSDPNIFLRYLIAAMRTIFPDACTETLTLLTARLSPPPAVLHTTLSNEVEQLPESFILVLDDYHTIHSVETHDLLNAWALHWPAPLHLVLISRISPPLPLARLRAKGQVNEIRTQDLRLTAEETAAYLNQAQSVQLSQPALRLLEERFEGWIAGLHLAAISLRSADNQEAVLSGLSGENANITGYLVDEVLAHQLPAIQTFLLRTSILGRFCAGLCEAVIETVDPAWNVHACLDWIERSDLFVAPLDNRREWYRYHHLFQELLQQRLSAELLPDRVSDLHRQASAWFETHGLLDEALQHALAAGDLDLAAHQMNAGLREVLNREDRPTLERWLRLLPEKMIQRRPDLLVIRVWALEFLWRLDLQAQVLQQVEALLESDRGTATPANDLTLLRGQIIAVRTQQAYFSNRPEQSIELGRQALAILPPTWTFVRGGVMLFLGMAMQAGGQAPAAERLLLDAYESCGDKTDAYPLMLLHSLCFNYLNSGQLEQTRQTAQALVRGATHSGIAIKKHWGNDFLGIVCYQRNELEAAAQYFTQIVENTYTAPISAYRDAVAGLALIHQIQGENAEAWRMVESISQFDLTQRGSEDNRTRSLRARLMLMQGDLEGAGQWVDTFTAPPPDRALLWLEEPQVTRARVLAARGAEADRQATLQLLDILGEIAERTCNTRYKIEILALRAVALEAQGEPGEANAELKQAIDLARLGGFIRVFVDLGKPMQAMLRRLAQQGHSGETINRILAAFPEADQDLVGGESPARPARYPSPGISSLADPLTPRELDVLTLLRGPSSIKEIALKLHISYATAKLHTINIYRKLDVNHRWAAVARAEELKLLPPR